MSYKIINSDDPQVVVDKVNEEMGKGWMPIGGLSIASWYPGGPVVAAITRYAQALVKE
jgi:hypothetical protein